MRRTTELSAGLLALGLAACADVVPPDGPGPLSDSSFILVEDLAAAKDQSIAPDLSAVDLSTVDLTPTCIPANCASGHEACVAGACVCDAGYVRDQNPSLSATGRGLCRVDTAARMQSDVCTRYASSGMVPTGFFSKSATSCDPGMLSGAGLVNALARTNFYRWLVGVPDVASDATQNLSAQRCALVTASNPTDPATVHNPPSTETCYTADGAAAAGSADIVYSPGNFVVAVDTWIRDAGNEANLGNRRAILRRNLNPVGIGIYVGGTLGSAACLMARDSTNTGESADFLAYPPPGFSPLQVAQQPWSFAWAGLSAKTTVTATVVRQSDGTNLAVNVGMLTKSSTWEDALGITPSGWTPQAGQIYRVTVTADALTWVYDVKPVSCP